jgi:hypothetical protein
MSHTQTSSNGSSLIKQHLVPPESKANLQRQFYKDDLRKWLYHHSTTVSEHVMKKHTHRTYYQNLVKSLRNEADPKAAAMLLIEANQHIQHIPEDVDEESLAGEVVKQELQKEFTLLPSKEHISPAVVLTERRRKLIIDKLQNGGFDNENHLINDQDITLSTQSFGDRSRFNYEVKIEQSEQGPFEPKWGHYNTMRMRWRYIRPQTQLLVPEQHIIAPRTNTNVMKSAEGEKINANFVDIVDFNTKRTVNKQERRGSPALFQTTGALNDLDSQRIYHKIATRRFETGQNTISPPRPKKKGY